MYVEFTKEELSKPFMDFDNLALGKLCKAAMTRLNPSDQTVTLGAMAAAALLTKVTQLSANKEFSTEIDGYVVTVVSKS
jgi:hypothetical protein